MLDVLVAVFVAVVEGAEELAGVTGGMSVPLVVRGEVAGTESQVPVDPSSPTCVTELAEPEFPELNSIREFLRTSDVGEGEDEFVSFVARCEIDRAGETPLVVALGVADDLSDRTGAGIPRKLGG